jgi:uncharacterized protein YjiS (DUF1127 family)
LVLDAPQFAGGGRIVLNLTHCSKTSEQPPDPGGFFYGWQVLQNAMGKPTMLSTTNDLRIGNIEQLRPPDMERARNMIGLPQGDPGSSTAATSAKSAANVYPFAKPARNAGPARRALGWIVQVWWERWLERRWFARALPWLADEVLEDYGLTREQARRLCRRPFWLA